MTSRNALARGKGPSGRWKVLFWRGALAAGAGAAAFWLLRQAMTVDVDYYDGYETLCNARFFAGLSPQYIANRFPALALLLAPAELLKEARGLSPMDVRPDHVLTALLHLFTLWAAWKGLARAAGRGASTVIAFFMAVPNLLFISYSSFISHDLFPGVLLLWMLLWADRFARAPRWQEAAGIVAAGLAAALIKPTYFLFTGSAAAVIALRRAGGGKRGLAPLLWMPAAVGAGFFLVMGLVLGRAEGYGETSFLSRPLAQLTFISGQYGNPGELFPWWLYIRNFPAAFGSAVSFLLLPGFLLSAQKRGRALAPAAAFVLCWAGLHLLQVREVRYMAFLAPVIACLVAPALRMLRKFSKPLLGLVMLLWGLDLAGLVKEASRLRDSFYTRSEAKLFLSPLVSLAAAHPVRIIVNQPALSFVSPFPSPFLGDRYHGYFHLGMHHIAILNKGVDGPVPLPPGISSIEQLRPVFPAGRVFVLSNRVLMNGLPGDKGALQQSVSLLEARPVKRRGLRLELAEKDGSLGSLLHPVVTFNGKEWAEVREENGGFVMAAPGPRGGPDGVVQGFRVLSRSDRPAGP